MKTTLAEIITYNRALISVSMLRLPAKVSYAIMRNAKIIGEEAARYEKMRVDLCEKYANKDDDGNPAKRHGLRNGQKIEEYDIPEESMGELTAEVTELGAVETEVDIRTVKQEDLEAIDRADRYDVMTPAQMMAIEFMIEG